MSRPTQKRRRPPKHRRACPTGKLCFPDKKAALQKIHMVRYSNPERNYVPVRAYKCDEGCPFWHVTSLEEWR